MLTLADLQLIAWTTVCCTAAVTLLALLALHLSRRSPIATRFAIVVVAPVLAIATSTAAIAAEMYVSQHDLRVLLWVVAISAVMSLAAAWLVGRAARRSIRALRDSARRVGDGHIVEARLGQSKELAEVSSQLADASQRLAAARRQLNELDAARRRFFAWISHDLRTPLTGVSALAEALDEGMADDPAAYVRRIRQQTAAMTRLVDDLFELSRLESGSMRPCREPVELGDIVSDAVADVRHLSAGSSVDIVQGEVEPATVDVDPHLINRVMVNLLTNALRYAPPGTSVQVATRRSEESVVLSVTDRGPGVPYEDLERMFQVGWLADGARTPSADTAPTGGSGLGLAIVRAIADAHGGRVWAEHVPDGFRLAVALPVSAAEDQARLV